MQRLLLTVGLACGLSVGCSKPVCETLRASLDGLDEKARPCGDGAGPTAATAAFDVARCRSAQPRCEGEDRRRLDEFARCLDGLPTCDPATKPAWERQAVTCAMVAQSLSAVCSTALGGDER